MARQRLCVVALLLAACGTVPDRVTDGGGGDDASAGEAWTVEHLEPWSLGSWFHAAGYGSRIYFSRDASDGTEFFRSYQTGQGGTVQDEMFMADLCACGYGSDLVAGTSELYYVANLAHAFDPLLQMWRELPYPMENQRGEAAVAFLGDTLYFVGGRGPLDTCQMFVVPLELWDLGLPPYPQPVESARAVALAGRIYVMGGFDPAGPVSLFASWAPGEAQWTRIGDIPESSVSHAVAYKGQVWAQSGSRFRIFDPASEQWLPEAVAIPTAERGIPVVVIDDASGEEVLYFVEAGATTTRFLRYNR